MALKLPNLATVQKGSIGVDAVAEKWTTLSSALDQIYALKQSNCSFQVLHQASYQLVLHNHGEVLYKKLEEKIAARITLQKDIIRNAAINMSATKLLITLAEQWAIHEVTTRRTCDIFPHLERVYCQSAKKQLIGPMSTRHFGTIVLSDREICEASLKAFYDMVDRDRRGDEAPQFMLLRSISNIFVAVDRATFFEALLEKRYIELTKHFYTQEASQMAGSENVPLYIEHYNKRLQDEIRRAASCMDTTTVQQVERIVTSCFITAHGEEIINKETSGVHALLREWRLPELTAIYQAFARVFATGEVILSMAAFLRTEGTIIVTNTEYIENPVTFVEKIIDLRGKIDVLLREVMVRPDKPGIDRYAEVELLRAFDDVVNRQSFTADYLSRLLDAKLRSQCSDGEIDKISEQIMSIFGRLRDKDVFESAYRNHLARRLLLGRSSSGEDQERIFIAKLKRECGVSATSSLEGMFADRATSDDLMDKFRDKLEERGERIPVALSVFVLTSSFWPPPVELKMRLHPDMARSAKIFEMYYLNRHHGRKFEYSFANGSVDIRLNFGGKKYDLNVPVMCSTVLLACEDDEFRTLEDLAGQSGMTVSDTAKAVASLARPTPTNAAILITDSAGSSVNAATKVKFNGQFKAKQLKIRVAIAVSTKEKTGASAAAPSKVREQIDEDRKYKIDAAVVRIMKSRKVLDHSTLLAEVIGVTKTFCPSPDMIKKRIEHLIEREFLERAEDDRNVYHYLA